MAVEHAVELVAPRRVGAGRVESCAAFLSSARIRTLLKCFEAPDSGPFLALPVGPTAHSLAEQMELILLAIILVFLFLVLLRFLLFYGS